MIPRTDHTGKAMRITTVVHMGTTFTTLILNSDCSIACVPEPILDISD